MTISRSGTIVFGSTVLIGAVLVARTIPLGAAVGRTPLATTVALQASGADPVARGAYLVKSGACNDCHTPLKTGDNGPEPDMTRMLSGHPAELAVPAVPTLPAPWLSAATSTLTAWSGPWGRSHTANLTPDRETGLGTWTAQQFIDTIRNGKHQGTGRPLLPPMPWEAFRHYADEDLASMFAYLQSIPAIRNNVPEPVPPPGAPVPPPGEAVPPPDAPAPLTALRTAPTHGDPVARGKYLVTAIGCGDCHTPMTMGPKGPAYVMSRMLSGYPSSSPVPANPALQGWGEFGALEPAFAGAWGVSFAANLTPDAETGLGAWTEQQFLDTLRNGRHQGRGRQLLPPMPWPAFGQKDDADLKAIFAYLRTVPAVRNKVPDPVAPAGK